MPGEKLKAAMRKVLDRPELADLVIATLSRWKDWEVQDEVVKLYGQQAYDIPSIKRAVVRYLFACAQDVPKGSSGPAPEHVAEAKKHLEAIRERDPKMVRDVERFL